MKNPASKEVFWKRLKPRSVSGGRKSTSPQTSSELIYAIGDIHGRLDLLMELLEAIIFDRAHTISNARVPSQTFIVFLGDYIDRGHQSREVIEFLSQVSIVDTEIIFLKGNHEQVAIEFLNQENSEIKWLDYGGVETLSSYGLDVKDAKPEGAELSALKSQFADALPNHHLRFLNGLKSYWIRDEFMFVHAGVKPGKPVESQTDKEFLWIRDDFLNSIQKLPFIIVHGHTPEPEPVWDGRRIGVDTGAYISNTLTAAKLYKGSVEFLST